MAQTSNSLFFVFEGGEGGGKSTHVKLLRDWFNRKGYDVLLTKEPGGDEGPCQRIREILMDNTFKEILSDKAEFLLFEADRAQHVERVIMPALKVGKIVLCDRFEAASFAYQCASRRVCQENEFAMINRFATNGLQPTLVFWIDIEPEKGLARNQKIHKRDRFEQEDISFHRRVREGYRHYFEDLYHGQWMKLDGEQGIEDNHHLIVNQIQEMLE